MGSADRSRTENRQAYGHYCRRPSLLRAAQCDCVIATTRIRDRTVVVPGNARVSRAGVGVPPKQSFLKTLSNGKWPDSGLDGDREDALAITTYDHVTQIQRLCYKHSAI